MATPGISFELTERDRQHAIRYVEDSGFFKNRLADFLGISRPTLDKVLEEDPNFFTQLKRADAIFCKSLIDVVKKKSPTFILRSRYRAEFNEILKLGFDPEEEIQRINRLLEEKTTKDDLPIERYEGEL